MRRNCWAGVDKNKCQIIPKHGGHSSVSPASTNSATAAVSSMCVCQSASNYPRLIVHAVVLSARSHNPGVHPMEATVPVVMADLFSESKN